MKWEWGSDSTTVLCIGGVLLLSWVLALLHWIGYRKWLRTTGKVVRMARDPNPSHDDGELFAPVVKFTTATGEKIEFTEPLYSNNKSGVGKTVAVIYPPKDPKYARVAGNVYTLQLIIGAVGAVFVVIGLVGMGRS